MSTALESSDIVPGGGGNGHREEQAAAKTSGFDASPGRWRRGTSALRHIVSDPQRGRTGAAQLAVTAALLVPAWVALGLAAILIPSSHVEPGTSQASSTILWTLAGQLAVGAAVLSIMRAWAAREFAAALAAGGFLAYGIHSLVQVSTSSARHSGSASQIVGSACLLLAFGLVLVSVVHRPEDGRTHRPVILSVGALIVGLGIWTIVRPGGIGTLSETGFSGPHGQTGDIILAAAWTVLGVAAIYVGRSQRAELKTWIGFTAICLAQGHLALILIHDDALSSLASGVFQTIAIALILFGTIQALRAAISSNQGLVWESMLAFEGSEARRREEAHAHEEAIHNLRSAMTSITSATHLLVSGGKVPLGENERSELAAALQSELERARRLLSHEWDGGRRSFPLLDVLMPAVVTERSQGAVICLDVAAGTAVLGNPERSYEVFATLLENARRHAAGASVTLRARRADGWVTVAVEDSGPGLPTSGTDRIFERGWTTSDRRDGMGLGLYVARRLMEEQGGEVVACNSPAGGARFLVRFPAAEEILAGGEMMGPRVDQVRCHHDPAPVSIRPDDPGRAVIRTRPALRGPGHLGEVTGFRGERRPAAAV
jgi:signal transduction histidine kinase